MEKDWRFKVYKKVGGLAPAAWKPLRIILYGKYNFNDSDNWDNEYSNISESEIQNLNNRVPNIINKVLELTKPYDSILEVSAGFGNFVAKVDSKKFVEATELSEKAISHLENLGIPANQAKLPMLPYEDSFFDIIVTISVFEHLKNKEVIRQSFEECHRVCREGFILSVPYKCMQPWNNLIHNYDFKKDDIKNFSEGLFEMEKFIVEKDGVTQRSISFLRKI